MNQSTLKKDMAISALRGLASAGYFSQEQLIKMEVVLNGEAKEADPRWLSISEACAYAKFSKSSIWRYHKAGLLTIHRIGGKHLVDASELDLVIRADGKNAVNGH